MARATGRWVFGFLGGMMRSGWVMGTLTVAGCAAWNGPAQNSALTTDAKPVVVSEKTPDCADNKGAKIWLQNDAMRTEAVRVSAIGYGAPPPKYYPENQRRLMAMRAAKIDAYRGLSETINGLHIWGGTTLGDSVVKQDRYRVFLDSFVRGARIVSMNAHEDGDYEITVEVIVDQEFLNAAFNRASAACPHDKPAIVSATIANVPANFYYSEKTP